MIPSDKTDIDPQETQEWIESLEDELEEHGYETVSYTHLTLPTTPYV